MSDKRYVQVLKQNKTVEGNLIQYIEVWNVPEDFDDQEMRLYGELCANSTLNPDDAKDCVRNLRK